MSTASSSGPASPALITPREAEVVNGADVRFEWEAVETADSYVLQVAESARFDTIVLEEKISGHTSVGVADFFPTDESTFFWRVLAVSDDEVSDGSQVESFLAVDAEAADAQTLLSEKEKDTGPTVELVRPVKKDDAKERTIASDVQLDREKEIGVAEEGVASAQIVGLAVAIVVVITIAVFVLFAWTNIVQQQARFTAVSSQGSIAEQTNTEGRRQISQYEMLNEDEGRYRIPIDRAIDVVTEEYQNNE